MDINSRDVLIRAAKIVFARKGYDGATVKDLAEESGLNVSLVSYYFGGKEGLYRTCLENFGQGRLEAAERVLKPPSSREDFAVRLGIFSEEFLECHMQEPEIGAILHRECWTEHEVTRDIFKNTFLKMFETLVQFIELARKNGFLREDVNPMVTAGLYFGSLIHLIRSETMRKATYNLSLSDPTFRDQVVQEAVKNLTQGIYRPTGATP